MRSVTVEATAVCKGIEMTHGNSFHYLTFELDSGERVYFQVSIKCYMLIAEGDRCLITYKDYNLAKKKLKSFERIAKTVPASTFIREPEPSMQQLENARKMQERLTQQEPMELLQEPKSLLQKPEQPESEPKEPMQKPEQPAPEPKEPMQEPKQPAPEPKEPMQEPEQPAPEPKEPMQEPQNQVNQNKNQDSQNKKHPNQNKKHPNQHKKHSNKKKK